MANSPNVDAGSLVGIAIYASDQKVDDAIQVLSIAVTKAVNRIPMARIVVLDGDMPQKDFPISASEVFKPGAAIRIDAGYDDNLKTIFEGLVVRHGIRISGNNDARLVIECQDKAVKMTLGRKNANFEKTTDSAVFSKLIGNYGLTATVTATDVEYPELVQYYSTDWDFMLSRAEANGMIVLADGGTVTVRAPIKDGGEPALVVTYGEDLMEFHADIDARAQYSNVATACWDLDQLAVAEKTQTPVPLNVQGNLSSSQLAEVGGLSSFRLQTSIPLGNAALQKWSAAQQVKSGLAKIQGRLKFVGSVAVKAGGLIQLAGLGNRFNGNAFVSVVHHDISQGHWITEAEFGLAADWHVDRRDLAGPPAGGLIPPVEGLQIGLVTKLDADPEGQYKIQVSTPVMAAETATVWARLLQFYASNAFGCFFVPEIGDEVLLGYLNHDPSHPVILGSLYSKNRKPPYTPAADNFIKAIVTRTKLKIEFDEENKVVTIITPANNKVILSDKDKSILLQDENSNVVKLNPDGILMDTPKDIKITAKGTITIDAVGKIGITSTQDVNVSGLNINNSANVGFVAKGNATAELSASGQTTVKGALVMIN